MRSLLYHLNPFGEGFVGEVVGRVADYVDPVAFDEGDVVHPRKPSLIQRGCWEIIDGIEKVLSRILPEPPFIY